MSERTGPWLQTYSGLAFYYEDPQPEDIRIEDIAHALARICRFCGHIRAPFYSVAQHSVKVSRIVPAGLALKALLHDAQEAYITDVPTPLKMCLPDYQRIEDRVWGTIARKFGFCDELEAEIKRADLVALATERRDLLGEPPQPWCENATQFQPLATKIVPQLPEVAESLFMERFEELMAMNQ
jgi:uncharacterized protein